MKLRNLLRLYLGAALVGLGWCLFQPAASAAMPNRGAFNLGTLNGVFTVTDFKSINGAGTAAGWLTATVTDNTGTNQVGSFTNFPVKVPVSGLMSGGPITLAVEEPIVLPELSTNTCMLLGVVVGAIDVTLPGIGLNVHVNRISLVVRSDRDTTIGDLLCNVLGDDGLLGSLGAGPATVQANSLASLSESSTKKVLTIEQARGLVALLLGSGLPGTSVSSGPGPTEDPKADLRDLVQRVVTTIEPAKATAPQNPAAK